MSHSVAELPKVAGTCPEPLTAAIRRAVRSGGSWQETADRVVRAFAGRVPGPGLLSADKLAGDPGGYQTHLVHAEPDGSFSSSSINQFGSTAAAVSLPGPFP